MFLFWFSSAVLWLHIEPLFLYVVLQQTDLMFPGWIPTLKCFQHVSPPGQGHSLSREHGSALTQELTQEPVVLLNSWMHLCLMVSLCRVHGRRWARGTAKTSFPADSLWSFCCRSWLGCSPSFKTCFTPICWIPHKSTFVIPVFDISSYRVLFMIWGFWTAGGLTLWRRGVTNILTTATDESDLDLESY